jgi:phosphonate transport system substrate-binding protein
MLTFSSCSEKKEPVSLVKDKGPSQKTFTVALVPEQNVFLQKSMYRPLAEYMSKLSGLNVRTKLLDSYEAIYKEMSEDKVDAGCFGSLSYVVMDSKIPLDPIGRMSFPKTGMHYKGVIFARKNSGFSADIRSWRGKKIALVDKHDTAGDLFPKWYLHKKGITDFEHYFNKVIYSGSHDAAIMTVIRGDADIGCSNDWIFNRLFEQDPSVHENIVILAISEPVPSNTFFVKRSLDSVLKKHLKDALFSMDKSPEGREVLTKLGAVRFVESTKAEYKPVYDMLEDLDIKPSSFIAESWK